MKGSRSQAGAFTLLEVLVVIGAIAVLIGLSLPALRGARGRALESAVLAHQRDVGVVVTIYLNDHQGAFPYYGVPGTDIAPLTYHHEGSSMLGRWVYGDERGAYWMHPFAWAYFMLGEGYQVMGAFTGPERKGEPEVSFDNGVSAWDHLTHAAFAQAEYFSQGAEQTPRLHGGQRVQSVAYPSKKVVLRRWNQVRTRLIPNPNPTDAQLARIPNFLWFADGHGAMFSLDAMRAAAPTPFVPGGDPGMTTIDGVLGRDIP